MGGAQRAVVPVALGPLARVPLVGLALCATEIFPRKKIEVFTDGDDDFSTAVAEAGLTF